MKNKILERLRVFLNLPSMRDFKELFWNDIIDIITSVLAWYLLALTVLFSFALAVLILSIISWSFNDLVVLLNNMFFNGEILGIPTWGAHGRFLLIILILVILNK